MKIYQHILYWILVIIGLTLIFGNAFKSYTESFYFVSLLLPVVMGTSYFFNYYLVPNYLFPRKFWLFGLYTFYMVIVSLSLELLACIGAMLLIIFLKVNETGPLVTDVYFLALIMYFFVFLKSFLLLVKHYFLDRQVIHDLELKQQQLDQGYFTVRSERKSVRLQFEEVMFIESLADYVRIHTLDGREINTKQKISKLESELPDIFVRIHRSFLVNKNNTSLFTREYVMVGENEIPVGRSYKQNVVRYLEK